MQTDIQPYPASLFIDYPNQPLNRITTLFRMFTALPILVLLGLLERSAFGGSDARNGMSFEYVAGGLVFLPTVLMLLFRQKYPRWWFDWNLALTRFGTRVLSYVALLRDEYPSTDEAQAVHLDVVYPDALQGLNRWLPLVKWLLAIPHLIVLLFLGIAAFICVVLAWFVILFTGRNPRSLFDFVLGVAQWSLRVSAYAFLLVSRPVSSV